MVRNRIWKNICMSMVLFITVIIVVPTATAAPKDLSAVYKLKYSIVEAVQNEHFQVTADDNGRVKLVLAFISGGCIVINELKVQSVEIRGTDVKTVNLLWKCDRGLPCKAYIPVQLRASLELPEPGRYMIMLWEYDNVNSEKINLIGKQEIEFK